MWKEWEKAISTLTKGAGRLQTPLGDWSHELESDWDFWKSPDEPNSILVKTNPPTSHALIGGNYRKIFTPKGKPSRITNDCTPVPAAREENGIYVRGEIKDSVLRTTMPPPEESPPKWQQYFIDQTSPHTHPRELITQLITPETTTYIVTDGGASKTSGYYGWVIASESTILFSGSGRLNCHSTQLQSLRPETTAMLAATTFLINYLRGREVKIRSNIEHWVDNMTLVRRLNYYKSGGPISQKQMLVPDIDLQLQLESCLDQLHEEHYITIDTNHVKGHQDTKKD